MLGCPGAIVIGLGVTRFRRARLGGPVFHRAPLYSPRFGWIRPRRFDVALRGSRFQPAQFGLAMFLGAERRHLVHTRLDRAFGRGLADDQVGPDQGHLPQVVLDGLFRFAVELAGAGVEQDLAALPDCSKGAEQGLGFLARRRDQPVAEPDQVGHRVQVVGVLAAPGLLEPRVEFPGRGGRNGIRRARSSPRVRARMASG